MSLDQLLDQADVWIDKEDARHEIETMDGRYALNVYNWLKSRAAQIGFRYAINLAGMNLPDEDTVAYDQVTEAIDREQDRISDNPEAWIVDKPLMRALLARVAVARIAKANAPELGPRPQVEIRDFRAYEPKPFELHHMRDLDEERFGQRPGDEQRVFLVTEPGGYDDHTDTVLACFVGNRLAAYRYEIEAELYGGYAVVRELDDNNAGQTEGMYGQIRRYREPWTEIEYKTLVNLETGYVVTDYDPVTRVRNDTDPIMETSKEADGLRGRYNVFVKTTGPDHELEALRARHAHAVNTIRANVLADITKDMP